MLASDKLYQAVRPALSQDGSNVYINVAALLAWGQQQGATSEQIAAFGQVRAIGTSNFKPTHLQRLIDETGIAPEVNPVSAWPFSAAA